MTVQCGLAFLAIAASLAPVAASNQIPIARVDLMPNHPRPYVMCDWARVARDFDAFAFDTTKTGDYLPLIWWDNTRHNYDFPGFGLPAYVGMPGEVRDDQHEGICCMGAVIGASLVGIDKQSQDGRDYVRMCEKYFNRDRGLDLYLNNCRGGTGSFWYDTYPSILFAQLFSLYPNTPVMETQMRASADRMREAILSLGGDMGLPDFNHTYFSYEQMRPVDNGRWREPDAAAGYAWFEYMAYVRTGDVRYLQAADLCMRSLDDSGTDPFYECILPYGACLAARMNAELGRQYDERKLLNWCFGPTSEVRSGWGVIVDKWGQTDVCGLTGSTYDGYGFCMNTYDEIAALAPVARYDHRYARDIGKYILNAANSARLFFPNAMDDDAQTSAAWSHKFDPASCIGYEGCRRRARATAVANADFRTSRGRIFFGDVSLTHHLNETGGPRAEVLEETRDGDHYALDHVWTMPFAPAVSRWLAASVHTDGPAFRFSWATHPDGPWTPVFTVDATGGDKTYSAGLPCDSSGTLYIRAESLARPAGGDRPARLFVDALWLNYEFEGKSPYGMGDMTTGSPIGCPTDLGVYGSSHVGYLGGIVSTTNVPEILRVDLLRTDWFHAPAYPTYLYFNPYDRPRSVVIDVGPTPRDLYDTVSGRFLARGSRGLAPVTIPPDSALVIVLAPRGGKLTRSGSRVLIDGIAVNTDWPALSITSPHADAWLSGRIPLHVDAAPSGGDPIRQVRALLDGKEMFAGGRIPENRTIDTTFYPDGKHILTVHAESDSGGVDELNVPVYFLNKAGGPLKADSAELAAWEPYPGAPANAVLQGGCAVLSTRSSTWGALQSFSFELDLDRQPLVLLDIKESNPNWWLKLQIDGHDPWYIRTDNAGTGRLVNDIVSNVHLIQPDTTPSLTGKVRARLILGPAGRLGASVAVSSLHVIYQR